MFWSGVRALLKKSDGGPRGRRLDQGGKRGASEKGNEPLTWLGSGRTVAGIDHGAWVNPKLEEHALYPQQSIAQLRFD